MIDALKAGLVGLQYLVADLQTAPVRVGLWLDPRDEHPCALIRAAADVESPLASRVSLDVHLVDPV